MSKTDLVGSLCKKQKRICCRKDTQFEKKVTKIIDEEASSNVMFHHIPQSGLQKLTQEGDKKGSYNGSHFRCWPYHAD